MRLGLSIFWATLWGWIFYSLEKEDLTFYIIAWAITIVILVSLEILLRRDNIR